MPQHLVDPPDRLASAVEREGLDSDVETPAGVEADPGIIHAVPAGARADNPHPGQPGLVEGQAAAGILRGFRPGDAGEPDGERPAAPGPSRRQPARGRPFDPPARRCRLRTPALAEAAAA